MPSFLIQGMPPNLFQDSTWIELCPSKGWVVLPMPFGGGVGWGGVGLRAIGIPWLVPSKALSTPSQVSGQAKPSQAKLQAHCMAKLIFQDGLGLDWIGFSCAPQRDGLICVRKGWVVLYHASWGGLGWGWGPLVSFVTSQVIIQATLSQVSSQAKPRFRPRPSLEPRSKYALECVKQIKWMG